MVARILVAVLIPIVSMAQALQAPDTSGACVCKAGIQRRHAGSHYTSHYYRVHVPTCEPVYHYDTSSTNVDVDMPTEDDYEHDDDDTSSNDILDAVNKVFGMDIAENPTQNACAARHAVAEPTIAYAHTTWNSGDTCRGGSGEVWSSSPDPETAATMWLNSPAHASIIRSARMLACGAGASSAVCISYR